ncbi:MAG: Thiazole tautomerase TenI, partial [uncultured Nocardioides sp.]
DPEAGRAHRPLAAAAGPGAGAHDRRVRRSRARGGRRPGARPVAAGPRGTRRGAGADPRPDRAVVADPGPLRARPPPQRGPGAAARGCLGPQLPRPRRRPASGRARRLVGDAVAVRREPEQARARAGAASRRLRRPPGPRPRPRRDRRGQRGGRRRRGRPRGGRDGSGDAGGRPRGRGRRPPGGGRV